MKRIYNYILLSVLAFAAVSCIEEEFNNDRPSAESGDEVKFGLSLGGPETKTVYGEEANNAFPIYWVEGDKVQIFSPQCLNGRRNAEYKVELPANVENPNYADDLIPTGEYGVQWGGDDKAIFYSLYPSGNYTLSEDGKQAQNITISSSQNIVVNGSSVKSDMEDCLMYAKNDGGETNDNAGVPKGEVVNLHYDPISTVFMVTLNVASTSATDFTIQSITLTSANGTPITGTFSLNIADGSFGDWGTSTSSTSSSVSAQIVDNATGAFYTLAKGGKLEVPLFIAPVTGLNTDGWTIKVVANAKEYKKTLGSQDVAAGQIHKITLPNLSETSSEWEISRWMTFVPRNVYLSEVSIPGSWNSLNPDFQDSTSISVQYKAGVRAFHLDTRWKAEYNGSWGNYSESTFSNFELAIANGGDTYEVGTWIGLGDGTRVMRSDAPTFESCLSEITSNVQSDEYMVLFCSFAQDSYNNVTKTGKTWMQAISDACDKNDYVYDARNLNENTVVGDVLNSVIVIVNCEKEIKEETLPGNSKCLFVNIPNKLTSDYFPTTSPGFKSDNLHTASSDTVAVSSITMAVSQAQITSSTGSAITDGTRGYYPSFGQRTDVVNSILDWSQSNYGKDDYAHNKWIYLGLGGNTANSKNDTGDDDTADDVAAVYSPLIDNRIQNMANIKYYPVGIVFLNYVTDKSITVNTTTFSPRQTVENILFLNNKYRLQYDATKPVDYNPNAKTKSTYGSTFNTGGDAF